MGKTYGGVYRFMPDGRKQHLKRTPVYRCSDGYFIGHVQTTAHILYGISQSYQLNLSKDEV
jgi:hypothetical protein